LAKISPTRQENSTASADYRFEFQKRGQLFICAHNKAPSVAAIARQQSRSFARDDEKARDC
jgi:hypothetical protein